MIHKVICGACGKTFEASRRDKKTCSATCRGVAAKRRKTEAAKPPEVPIGLVASTLAELVKAGRENTALGQSALLLAYRAERATADTGSSVAAVVRQHNATLAEALKGAKPANAIDELRARRDSKRAG